LAAGECKFEAGVARDVEWEVDQDVVVELYLLIVRLPASLEAVLAIEDWEPVLSARGACNRCANDAILAAAWRFNFCAGQTDEKFMDELGVRENLRAEVVADDASGLIEPEPEPKINGDQLGG
jgi:hypothetical protein